MLPRQTLWILCIAILVPIIAEAAKPEDWTEAEVNMAAPYCIDTMGFRYNDAVYNTSPRAPHWVSIMGQSFWAMHHYCWALVNLNRAQRASMPTSQRQHLRKTAIDDMRYVLSKAPKDFLMLPEIYTSMGNTYLLLGDTKNAEKVFKAAMTLRPEYWPPYARWAEHLIIRGNAREEARSVIREGLTHAPGSKTLLALWQELGGGPLPTPVEKPTPPVANSQETPDAPVKNPPDAGGGQAAN